MPPLLALPLALAASLSGCKRSAERAAAPAVGDDSSTPSNDASSDATPPDTQSAECDASAPGGTARLVLERREGPLGGGADYTVEVHPDGRVLYQGRGNVRIEGKAQWEIGRADAADLFRQAACAGASSWKTRYYLGGDASPARVTVDLGHGKPVVVEDDPACHRMAAVQFIDETPASLCALEEAIDRVAGTKAYTECLAPDGGYLWTGCLGR